MKAAPLAPGLKAIQEWLRDAYMTSKSSTTILDDLDAFIAAKLKEGK